MSTLKQAKLFMQGGSQAVRLPAEFRFLGVDAVFVRRNASGDVVLSSRAPVSYAAFVAARDNVDTIPDDFLAPSERNQSQELRDPFSGHDDADSRRS